MRACASWLLIAALGLNLGGCAVSALFPDRVSDDSAGPEPVNYRFLVANALGGIIGNKDDPTSRLLEISSPRRVDAPRGATWMLCVKALRYPSRTTRGYYAVFIQRDKIVESRISVVLDQCETEPYSPFEWSVD